MRYPALHGVADAISATSQRRYLLALRVELGAIALGAAVGAVPAGRADGAGPIGAVVLFGVALAVRMSGAGPTAQRRWYDARAAAESVKSAAWQYAVGGEAYAAGDETAASRFEADLVCYLDQLPRLDGAARAASAPAVTAEMAQLRAQPVPERAAAYRRDRIDDQHAWYAANAAANERQARRWSAATVAAEVAALATGLVGTLADTDIGWLGIVATLAAALVAWEQAKRHTELSESYAVTAREVALLRSTVDELRSEAAWARFVHDAEAAFSREHTLWLARRQGPAG